jgi:peroxiredoxin
VTWVYFEDGDRQVSAPVFSLEQLGGSPVALQDFYEGFSLVLLFTAESSISRKVLERFAARLDEIERQGSQVLALLPVSLEGLKLKFDVEDLPYPLLADKEGYVRSKYAGLMVAELVPEGSAFLFILDTYGAPWAAYVGENLESEDLIDEVLSWLSFIGIQCPE